MKLRVSEICKAQGINLKDLADRLGISNVGLSQQINGNPKIDTLDKIAKALDVDVTDLFEKKEKEDNSVTCPNCGVKLKLEKE